MTWTDELDSTQSEFEEAYDAPESEDIEHFTSDLLCETIETLAQKQPFCVTPQDIVEDVIIGMGQRDQGCVLVTEGGVLVGIFTERDVIRKVVGKLDAKNTRIAQVMTPSPEAVSFHDSIAVALNKMTVGGFRHVPLVDIRRRPVGVVSVKDVIQYVVDRFPRHVMNVAPDPTERHPEQVSGAG
jgi:CBS domain-containing protein